MLNNEVEQQQDFTRVWTNDLNLQTLWNVSFGTPANVVVCVESGSLVSEAIEEAAKQNDVMNDERLVFVERGNCAEIDKNSMQVWSDMDVMLCHVVTVIGDVEPEPQEGCEKLAVEHGQAMTTNTWLAQLFSLHEQGLVNLTCFSTFSSSSSSLATAGDTTSSEQVVDCFGNVISDITVRVISLQSSSSSSSSSSTTTTSSLSLLSSSSSSSLSSSSSSSSTPTSDKSSSTQASETTWSSPASLEAWSSSTNTNSTHRIVMEFDGTLFLNETMTNETIKQAIMGAIGGQVIITNIEVIVDPRGQVTSAYVDVLCDVDTAQHVLNTIESIAHDENCGDGVLCRIERVYIPTLEPSCCATMGNVLVVVLACMTLLLSVVMSD